MALNAQPAFDLKDFFMSGTQGHRVFDLRRDEVVFPQYSPADAVFYIQKGKIKIVVASKQGKEAVVGILGAGDFFGEGCLIGQPLRLATARSMIASQVMQVSKLQMQRALQDKPVLAELFIKHLLTRNSRVEEDLIDQLFNPIEKRLARALLMLANHEKDNDAQPITVPISHETLAEIIGSTRPRVSYFMNKFKRLGFVEYNGHLKVHNSLLSILMRE